VPLPFPKQHFLAAMNCLVCTQALEESIPDFIEKHYPKGRDELNHFGRLLQGEIHKLPESEIEWRGHVIHTLEASIWYLLNGKTYK
jgi:hypothetical protein